MNEKRKIVALLEPKAVLKPATPEARRALPDGYCESGCVGIREFLFRVGRESRVAMIDGELRRIERPRLDGREPNNDLYLIDSGELLNVSREHLQIEKGKDGYVLVDRGSACGTQVAGRHIGGNDAGGSAPLKDGDTIGVGTESTPYLFTFITDLVPEAGPAPG